MNGSKGEDELVGVGARLLRLLFLPVVPDPVGPARVALVGVVFLEFELEFDRDRVRLLRPLLLPLKRLPSLLKIREPIDPALGSPPGAGRKLRAGLSGGRAALSPAS